MYKITKNKDGDVQGCNSCGTGDVPVRNFQGSFAKKEKWFMCQVCSQSLLGNAAIYPDLYSFVTPQMLGQVANIIIKKINEVNKK